jgi:N-acetyl-anhydromuramyl-L-alanine amidase AmpD
MPRPLFDTESIFGIHEPGGEHAMLAAGRPGWVVFCEAIGHDPNDRSGIDFTTFSSQGLGVICRLHNGYEPDGTLPYSREYENFARRVANFVSVSRGCKIWVIGNEMNYIVERPGIQIDWSRHNTRRTGPADVADPTRRGLAIRFNVLPDHSTEIRTTRGAMISPGEPITPERYARCYRLCREAIHRLPGHEDDQVLVGAVAPWNTQTMYTGNANGDWVLYFRDILTELGPLECDGFALHTYTHGPDPALITSDEKLDPPYQNYHRHFRAYRDFLAAVPANMRHLPAYITETDQVLPWLDQNSGWVRRAYAEINAWNQQPNNQRIRALALYRWPKLDKWYIDGKRNLIEDFHFALQNDYRWSHTSTQPATPPPQRVSERAQPAPPPTPAPEDEEQSSPPVHEEVEPAGKAGRTERRRAGRSEAQPAPPYQVEWLDDRFPPRLVAGEIVTATLTVRNKGSLTWLWGGGNPFRLGYHYYRGRRRLPLAPALDLRTDLPEDVPPGGLVTLTARIALPAEPGNYTLELDLVHEGVGWFKEQKSPVLTRWLTVEAPPPPPTGSGESVARDLPVPLFVDVTTRLPRSGAAYARRSLNQIRHVVISHTGAHPWLSLERIAQSHIAHGYPGIVYDFYVDPAGQVYRVSELENVAQPDQVWSEQGVNIALAGNFSVEPPPLVQLEATGRLCAWLAQNLGLPPESIVGLGELTRRGDNPGATFYRSGGWKPTIVRQVQLHLAALNNSGEESQPDEALRKSLAELREERDALRTELARAAEERDRLRIFNERLQIETAQLHRELEMQPEFPSQRLRIQNLIDKLPRDPHRYVERRAGDVRYIVINHTGVPPTVSWQEIARAHIVDWPGLLYDFCIDEQGVIYQTQPLTEVVETDQVYLSQAINIAFAGEFNRSVPNEEQIYAGGQLIAWLMERFPAVTLEQVRGIREFIDHTSPGEQWLSGKRWKEELLAAVRRAGGLVDPTEEERRLRQRIAELDEQLEAAQQLSLVQQQQKAKLEEENHRLKLELAEKTQLARGFVIPPPSLRNIAEQLPRHPTLRYERRALSQITHIAVHHTATPPTLGPERIAELHIAADPGRGKEAWPGIGYHYFVHADGNIEQTNPLEIASYHVYRHNGYSVGVVFAGSFMNGKIPTTAQLRSGAHLVAWLMQELQIPLARVWGHREFPENSTVCPGSEWTGGNRWRDLLFERIEQIQNGIGVKSIRHYLLLWQRNFPGPVARQDLVNAIGYIARFRPSVGFSVEDARYAEYVTIIGNEAGVSADDEQFLRTHGCHVERVAGRNEEETGRLLAELVRQGRRFMNFDVDF